MNPLDATCPICRASAGHDCKGVPPGFQHGPRAVAKPDPKPGTLARIAPHNGEPHVIVTLPDGTEARVLQLQGETMAQAVNRRRAAHRDLINQLQRECDQLDTAIGIIARESHA